MFGCQIGGSNTIFGCVGQQASVLPCPSGSASAGASHRRHRVVLRERQLCVEEAVLIHSVWGSHDVAVPLQQVLRGHRPGNNALCRIPNHVAELRAQALESCHGSCHAPAATTHRKATLLKTQSTVENQLWKSVCVSGFWAATSQGRSVLPAFRPTFLRHGEFARGPLQPHGAQSPVRVPPGIM